MKPVKKLPMHHPVRTRPYDGPSVTEKIPSPENRPAMAVVQRGPNRSRSMPPGSMPTDWKTMNSVNIRSIWWSDHPYVSPMCPEIELQLYSNGLITSIAKNAAIATRYRLYPRISLSVFITADIYLSLLQVGASTTPTGAIDSHWVIQAAASRRRHFNDE